jgi:hypothetical protein
MMEDNPFKRDERADMKDFWWAASGIVGALFLAVVVAALWAAP